MAGTGLDPSRTASQTPTAESTLSGTVPIPEWGSNRRSGTQARGLRDRSRSRSRCRGGSAVPATRRTG
jgi:hypothetical protein